MLQLKEAWEEVNWLCGREVCKECSIGAVDYTCGACIECKYTRKVIEILNECKIVGECGRCYSYVLENDESQEEEGVYICGSCGLLNIYKQEYQGEKIDSLKNYLTDFTENEILEDVFQLYDFEDVKLSHKLRWRIKLRHFIRKLKEKIK
jgi:hypothetical protein